LANHLYGKLGVKNFSKVFVLLDDSELDASLKGLEIKRYKQFGTYYLCELNDITPKTRLNNFAVVSAITAKARIKTYGLMQDVLSHNDKICLVNTDEVIINSKELFKNKRKSKDLRSVPYTLRDGMLF
jgi:hypothetical protein